MTTFPKLDAFEKVRAQIGACGIWCGSCIVGNGTLRELSARYGQMLADYGLEEWGPQDFNYEELQKGLASMQHVPLCPGCRQGGGRQDCEIRACAAKRQVEFCGECVAAADCEHGHLLEHMRRGAVQAGLFVETAAADPHELVDRWTAAIKGKWPTCVLFA